MNAPARPPHITYHTDLEQGSDAWLEARLAEIARELAEQQAREAAE